MAKLVVGVLQINGVQGGRSEKYYFKGSDNLPASQFTDKLKQIAWGRSAFFGSGVELVYARCSTIGKPPDKETVEMNYPVGPHPSWTGGVGPGNVLGPVNDDNVAVFQCFQLTGGKWANHYYNFCPDDWLTGMKLATGILPFFQPAPGTVTDLSPTSGLNHLQVCQGFWNYLIANCCSAHPVTSTNYTPSDINRVVFRNVTRHNVGRFFGQHRGRRPTTLIS